MSKSEVELPVLLASDGFTLEEIGALFVLMTTPHLDKTSKWFHDEKLKQYLNFFIEKEIIVPSTTSDGDITLEIDLTWL